MTDLGSNRFGVHYYRTVPGHCTRCDAPFAPDAWLYMVRERIFRCSYPDIGLNIVDSATVPVCAPCLKPDEQAEYWTEGSCQSCGHRLRYHPKFGPGKLYGTYPWCSSRCEQRVRRRWRKETKDPVEKVCACCQKPFFPARSDAVYCSSACRQWSYRARSR